MADTPDTRPSFVLDESPIAPIPPDIFELHIPDVLQPTSEPITVYRAPVPNYWLVQDRRAKRSSPLRRR
ncbi:MAG: hypothetical protein HYT09_03460 [Candidatus Levybacteria bacterium]|nr:hypothetical protein [Candidatus Levybacteria bacterium]